MGIMLPSSVAVRFCVRAKRDVCRGGAGERNRSVEWMGVAMAPKLY